MTNAPIGIFDSGIGGLTVANAIKKVLPHENIIYYGDTAHLPYGEKSSNSIQSFSKNITNFLINQNCKAIVIACNSASSVAYNIVKETAENIPVFNVIEPVISFFNNNIKEYHIGVIGTKATINSNIYTEELKTKNPDAKVYSLETPLLAPMIEEGFINGKISKTIIDNYLSNKILKKINHLILACTHYPLIHNEIDSYYHQKVKIINSSSIVAKYIKKMLGKKNMLSKNRNPNYKFYVSLYTKSFEESAKFFFEKDVKLKEKKLFV
tara:strand:+ start:207 stop:1007 length:801 start_codon:yes stop_codon:yes gene_type:complete